MTKAEKFVNDFMKVFDENGLDAPENIMYLRAYKELEILQELKSKTKITGCPKCKSENMSDANGGIGTCFDCYVIWKTV